MASKPQTKHVFNDCFTGEPSLEELFAEPIVQLFMKRDHVNPLHMRNELFRVLDTRCAAEA